MRTTNIVRNDTYGGHISRQSHFNNSGKGRYRIVSNASSRKVQKHQQKCTYKRETENNISRVWRTEAPARENGIPQNYIIPIVATMIAYGAVGVLDSSI